MNPWLKRRQSNPPNRWLTTAAMGQGGRLSPDPRKAKRLLFRFARTPRPRRRGDTHPDRISWKRNTETPMGSALKLAWKEDSEPVQRRRPTARAARVPSGTGWPKKRRLVTERRREPRGNAASNRPDRAVAREGIFPRGGNTQPERALTWARRVARSGRRRLHIEGEVGCRPRRKTPL